MTPEEALEYLFDSAIDEIIYTTGCETREKCIKNTKEGKCYLVLKKALEELEVEL